MSKKLRYQYTLKAGEQLDEVVYRHYQTHKHLQMVMNANPGLSKYGVNPPPGMVITLPPEPEDKKTFITMWG